MDYDLVEEEPAGTREKRMRGSEWIPPLDWEQPKQVPHWDELAAIPLTRQHESSRGEAREPPLVWQRGVRHDRNFPIDRPHGVRL